MSAKNIRSRFAITFIANVVRSLLNFATGLVIARSMGPERYGDVVFLLGGFEAIRQAVNMGTSQAFFTFISQRHRGRKFILAYLGWQLLQLILTLAIVGLLLPGQWFDKIWLGHDRDVVVLACLAVFLQGQAWPTAMQIGEAKRLTLCVQIINVVVAVAHFIIIAAAAWLWKELAVKFLLILLSVEYVVALFAAYGYLAGVNKEEANENEGQWQISEWIKEYSVYCMPLLFYCIGSFLFEFSDKWFLQHFGGAGQQGLYGVSSQFSTACLLAATSMVRILWKEAAELHHNGDYIGLRRLYESTSRALYGFGAVIGGFLWPWSADIAVLVLGESYRQAWLPLAILFLYPTHQSLSQVMQTLFLATGNTMTYFWIGMTFMMIGIPVTYFTLAPASASIPGLGLGAAGMAIKTLVLNVICTNAYVWYLSQKYQWKMAIGYQFVVLGWSTIVGGVAYWLVTHIPVIASLPLLAQFVISGIIYSLLQLGLIVHSPQLFGIPKEMLVKVGLGRIASAMK